jgi:hypothetical protein
MYDVYGKICGMYTKIITVVVSGWWNFRWSWFHALQKILSSENYLPLLLLLGSQD